MSVKKRIAWGALLGLAMSSTPVMENDAEAGWRELGFVVVSMHEGDDTAARGCYVNLRKALVGEEGSDVVHVRQSRANVVKRLGEEAAAKWTTADAKAFEPLIKWEPKTWRGPDGKTVGSGYVVDAWVLVDCQPGEKRLDIVSVVPATSSVSRLQVSNVEIDKKARKLAAEVVMKHAWADWMP